MSENMPIGNNEKAKSIPFDAEFDSPDKVLVNDDGDITVPGDFGAYVTDEFMYEDESRRLNEWRVQAAQQAEDAAHEELMRSETIREAHDDIDAQLAVIAVKQFFGLQDKIIEAQQAGDRTAVLQLRAEMNRLTARHPGLIGPQDVS